MKHFKLNTKKVRIALGLRDKNETWLAKQCGVSKQVLSDWMKRESLAGVKPIAKVLGFEPKDLIEE